MSLSFALIAPIYSIVELMVHVCNVMMLKMTLLSLFFILITHFTHFIAAFSYLKA